MSLHFSSCYLVLRFFINNSSPNNCRFNMSVELQYRKTLVYRRKEYSNLPIPTMVIDDNIVVKRVLNGCKNGLSVESNPKH